MCPGGVKRSQGHLNWGGKKKRKSCASPRAFPSLILLLGIKPLQAKANTKKVPHLHRFYPEDGALRVQSVFTPVVYFAANHVTSLSLQVVGGKMTESGRLCAFITKVRKGSLADTVGHLRPGIHTHVQHTSALGWNPSLKHETTASKTTDCLCCFLRWPSAGVEWEAFTRSHI